MGEDLKCPRCGELIDRITMNGQMAGWCCNPECADIHKAYDLSYYIAHFNAQQK